jgi:hypothetical protein
MASDETTGRKAEMASIEADVATGGAPIQSSIALVVLAIAVTAVVLASFAADTAQRPETFDAIVGIGIVSVILDAAFRPSGPGGFRQGDRRHAESRWPGAGRRPCAPSRAGSRDDRRRLRGNPTARTAAAALGLPNLQIRGLRRDPGDRRPFMITWVIAGLLAVRWPRGS